MIGKEINVNMSGAIRDLQELTGKQYIHVAELPEDQKLDAAEWRAGAITSATEDAKRKIIDQNPRVEIALAEAWEEIDEVAEVEQVQNVTRHRINWQTMQTEAFQTQEVELVAQATGRKVKRLKQGVTFDPVTGKCFRQRTLDDVTLPQETRDRIQATDLPKYIKDRLPTPAAR